MIQLLLKIDILTRHPKNGDDYVVARRSLFSFLVTTSQQENDEEFCNFGCRDGSSIR